MFDRHRMKADDATPFRGLSAPWGPLPAAQFAAWTMPADDTDASETAGMVPEPSAFEAGFAEGWVAAETQLTDSFAAQHDAQQNLAHALAQLTPALPAAVAATLRSEVITLLESLVGSASIDAGLLGTRCAELAALASPDAPATLHLHPDDAALMADLTDSGPAAAIPGAAILIVADPGVARGSARLVDGAGMVEAGPAVMIDRLRAHWNVASDGAPIC